MRAVLVVLAAGVGSFGLRYGVVAVIDRIALPAWFERLTAYVMPAVFAGLAAMALADPVTGHLATAVPLMIAMVVTVAVAIRRSTHVAVLAGMSALWCATGGLHLL